MRYIKVKILGEFKQDYNDRIPKGTKIIIDRVRPSAENPPRIQVRVVNLWKKPTWFDSGWFKFYEKWISEK